MTRLVDTHAHIQGHEFDDDRDDTVRRAVEAGLVAIVVPGVDLESSVAAVRLAERHETVYAAAGYHPHEASRLDQAGREAVESLLAHERVVAVGEIGLDFYRNHSPREAQIEAIEFQLGLAAKYGLPVIVHNRDSQETLWPMLRSWAASARASFADQPLGVMHYFSGTPEEAAAYTDLGFMISIHTSVTHPKADLLRSVVAETPVESLVIETDSPYGAPQVLRGKRNEPAFVREAAVKIGEVKQTNEEAIAVATTANAARLFRLRLPQAAGYRTGVAS